MKEIMTPKNLHSKYLHRAFLSMSKELLILLQLLNHLFDHSDFKFPPVSNYLFFE